MVTTPKQLQVIQASGGFHTVTATYAPGTGFNGSSGSLVGGLDLVPAPLTITAKTNTKTYDASTSAASVPTVTGLLTGDTVTGLTEAYSDKNATSNKTLSVSGYTINDGNGGNNYAVTTVTNAFGQIKRAPLTVTASTNTKTYDNTTSAAAIPTVTGLLGSDTASGLSELYSSPTIGQSKTLTVSTFTLNDSNNGNNYSVTEVANNTGVISPPLGFMSDSGTGQLTISLATNQTLGIVSTGNNYIFSSNGLLAAVGQTDPANQSSSFVGLGTTTLTMTSAGIAHYTGGIEIIDSGNGAAVTFNGGAYTNNFDVLLSNPLTGTITFNGTDSFGNFNLHAATRQGIIVSNGALVSSINGNIAIQANTQAVTTSGDFNGVTVNGGTVQSTGNGQLLVQGVGGGGGNGGESGVLVENGGTISGANGNVQIIGQGTSSSGVFSGSNYGVYIAGGSVTSTGNGTVTVQGTGGISPGGGDDGVYVAGSGSYSAVITSGGGNVLVAGTGGGSSSGGGDYGVGIGGGGEITAGGQGSVTVQGTGGFGGGSDHGVYLTASTSGSAVITSGGGKVMVTGLGGGLGESGQDDGVFLDAGGQITAGGAGSVTIQGTGGPATGDFSFGLFMQGTDSASATITSSGGDVQVTGFSGNNGNISGPGHGVWLRTDSQISAGGMGNVSVTGTGGALPGGAGNGVYLNGDSLGSALITSHGGNVNVTGSSGNGHFVYGVAVDRGGEIEAGGTGTVTVIGMGIIDYGVWINSNGVITSQGGNVNVTGIGGTAGTNVFANGIELGNGGVISATGSGNINVTGTGGGGANAVDISGGSITASKGNIQVAGTPGGLVSGIFDGGPISTQATAGSITLLTDYLAINNVNNPNGSINAGTGTVNIFTVSTSQPIDIGGQPQNSLNVTNFDFSKITAATINIGTPTSGAVTFDNPVTLLVPSNVNVVSGSNIIFKTGSLNTDGGQLTLTTGNSGSVQPLATGTDVTTAPAALSFGSNSTVAIAIPALFGAIRQRPCARQRSSASSCRSVRIWTATKAGPEARLPLAALRLRDQGA